MARITRRRRGARPPAAADVCIRLYVTGLGARSRTAIENARALCDGDLGGHCTLEVVDVRRGPVARNVPATPALVRLRPLPVRRHVGRLDDEDEVRAALALKDLW